MILKNPDSGKSIPAPGGWAKNLIAIQLKIRVNPYPELSRRIVAEFFLPRITRINTD